MSRRIAIYTGRNPIKIKFIIFSHLYKEIVGLNSSFLHSSIVSKTNKEITLTKIVKNKTP